MTVVAQDDDGNRVVIKQSGGLAKFQYSGDHREEILEVLAGVARMTGLPLVDMDNVVAELKANYPCDYIEVWDYANDRIIEIEFDIEEIDDFDDPPETAFGRLDES